MTFYVKRTRLSSGRVGWTGPIRSARQAERERAAWTGEPPYADGSPPQFAAEVLKSTPEIRAEVRAWQTRWAPAWAANSGHRSDHTP
jgi:hypothetical protein